MTTQIWLSVAATFVLVSGLPHDVDFPLFFHELPQQDHRWVRQRFLKNVGLLADKDGLLPGIFDTLPRSFIGFEEQPNLQSRDGSKNGGEKFEPESIVGSPLLRRRGAGYIIGLVFGACFGWLAWWWHK